MAASRINTLDSQELAEHLEDSLETGRAFRGVQKVEDIWSTEGNIDESGFILTLTDGSKYRILVEQIRG